MKNRAWHVVVAALAITLLNGHTMSATVPAVSRVVGSLRDPVTGTELCQPSIPAARRYTTIQAAVDASIASASAATIWVCPGVYPEQVKIGMGVDYEPIITLQGSNLTAGPAVIAAPATWTPYFSKVYGWTAAQVLVTDTKGVTIKNLVVDGGSACPSLPSIGAPSLIAGVMFVDNGDPVTSTTEAGVLRFVEARNIVPIYRPDCGFASGIVAQNSYMEISDNIIHDVSYGGILEYGGNAEMLRNTISHTYTAIRSTGGHPIDVSLNVISESYYGIVLEYGANGVQVDQNTFNPSVSTAIYLLGAFGNYVRNNTIKNPWVGVAVEGVYPNWPTSANLVEGNKISNCGFACLSDSISWVGTNRFDNNTLTNSAAYGVWLYYVADFLENGTSPEPPLPPYLDWDSIYSNPSKSVPIQVCHAVYNGGWGCAAGDQ
jgi:hypothetical protein